MNQERPTFRRFKGLNTFGSLTLALAATTSWVGSGGKGEMPPNSKPDLFPTAPSSRTLEGLPSIQLLQELIQAQPNPQVEIREGLDREFAARVKDLINEERQKIGLHTLTVHPALNAAAEGYAKFIVDNGYTYSLEPRTAHSLDGRTVEERARAQGYTGTAAGEAIGGRTTPEATVQTWLDSPPHRNNIFSSAGKDVGIGCSIIPNNPNRLCVTDLGIPPPFLPIENQLSNCYIFADTAWHFDSRTQIWTHYHYGAPTQFNTLTEFRQEQIYFVHLQEKLPGCSFSPSNASPNIQLSPGWSVFVWK